MLSDRAINDAVEKLDEAIEAQTRLVTEVEKLHTSKRRLTTMFSVLAGVVVLSVIAVFYAIGAARDAEGAVQNVEQVVERQNADREAARLDVCRVRNAGFVGFRDSFNAVFDVLEQSFDTPENQAFVDDVRAVIPTAAEIDTDCNRDGTLDADDYPEE